jgi:Gram-negative bacterial TonB protein C-terminal
VRRADVLLPPARQRLLPSCHHPLLFLRPEQLAEIRWREALPSHPPWFHRRRRWARETHPPPWDVARPGLDSALRLMPVRSSVPLPVAATVPKRRSWFRKTRDRKSACPPMPSLVFSPCRPQVEINREWAAPVEVPAWYTARDPEAGTGHGADPNAKAGVSATPGPGGAGSATSGTPAVPGVSVTGGSSMVTVDFGSNVGSGDPSLSGRSSLKDKRSFGVTVQGTASSGGAFDFYHLLQGATRDIYIDGSPLPAVMRYSEPANSHKASGNLADPEAIHTDLPAGLPHVRLVVTCVLDASGNLKNLHVLEAGPADMTAKVMAALQSWKFSPVMIGNQAVEVNAILGFNIDTNDRH